MAARIVAGFTRRCMDQVAKSAKKRNTAEQIASLAIPVYLGGAVAVGFYQGFNESFNLDDDSSKSTRIKRACAGAKMRPRIFVFGVEVFGK